VAMLEGRNLRKTYRLSRRNSVEALAGVDIDIEAGQMVAIMGPSGSGKSTLMHILGLLHSPDGEAELGAELRIDGRDMTRLSDSERTRMRASVMGFVFQSFNLVPTLTALENVALAAEYAGVPGREARSKAREALTAVGLAERADHRPLELSGGEQQRVAISRSLVNRPKLLMGDELTGNLDTKRSAEVLAMLRRLNQERGLTIILVTHDPEVGAACDRIVRMRDGLIVGVDTRSAPPSPLPAVPASLPLPALAS
jgi:putative ABC transport system ATP-binding protein